MTMREHFGRAMRRLVPRHGKEQGFTIHVGSATRELTVSRKAQMRFNGRDIQQAYYSSFSWRKRNFPMDMLPENEANPHVVIVGASGYGKSTLLKQFLSDLAREGKPTIIFDGHGEHGQLVKHLGGRSYDASRSNINLLALDGASITQRMDGLVSMLSDTYGLGYLQRASLNSALYYTYRKLSVDMASGKLSRDATLADLLSELSIFIANAKGVSERNRLEHLRQRISSLQRVMPVREHFSAETLLSGMTAFSLSGIESLDAKAVYLHETIRRLYSLMRRQEMERGVRLYVVIDESRFLVEKAGGILTSLVTEGRKFGYALVIVTNSSSMLPRDIIANSSTFIAFHIGEPGELSYISSVIGRGIQDKAVEVKSMIDRLGRNQAVMSCSSGIYVVETPKAHGNVPLHGCEAGGTRRKLNVSEEHDSAVRGISERLGTLGVRHYLTNGRGPDIVAYCNGRAAIEYETGRKSFEETARMIRGRKDAYARTVVFVNDAFLDRYKGMEGAGIEVVGISKLGSFDLRNARPA